MEIGRLLTAMVTPMTASGDVDYDGAKRLAVALVDSGNDGVIVSGTTGESPTLSNAEKVRLFAEVKGALGSKGAVIAGTGNYSTAESIELTREAEAAGADGVLLVTPYYNKPPQEGLYRHFSAIAESTRLPAILYNVPGRTGVNMTADTTIRLSAIPNIIGVKEASGDLDQSAKIISGASDGFRVWSGNDNDTLPLLSIGAYGVISVVGHIVGGQIKSMINHFLAGETRDAAEIHRRLLPLVNVAFVVANPIPIKYMLNQVGFPAGPNRLPLVEPDEATASKILAELKKHRIDLPVAV